MTDVNMVVVWLVLLILFVIVELVTIQLVAVWFCFGSLGALIAALLNLTFNWQLVIFLIISLLLIIFTRPIVKKFLMPKIIRTNYDSIIGMECIVLEDIVNIQQTGSVKVSGKIWTARSKNNDVFKSGDLVRAVGISGVKLIIDKIEKN